MSGIEKHCYKRYAIQPEWIYTSNQNQDLLDKHTVIINDGLIENIIPSEHFQRETVEYVFELHQSLLTPGLINNHTHAAMSFLKGISDDQQLQDWLEKTIWPAESKFLSSELVFDGAQLSCLEMLSSGITTFNDMYFYPDSTARAALNVGIRANIGLVFMDIKTNYATDFTDYLDKGFFFRDNFRDESLITTSLAPHAPYTVNDDSFLKIRTYADQLGLNIHCHIHETDWEIQDGLKNFGMRPIERLEKLGVLGPDFMGVHCVQMVDSDLSLIEKNQMHVISCPTSNLKLASGALPINDIIKKRIGLSIGSDSSASNNKISILEDLKLFSLLQRLDKKNDTFLSDKDLIDMVTINSANALNLSKQIGSIEVGKRADITAFDLSGYKTEPIYNPLSSLIYSGSSDCVNHVWVDGNLKFSKGMFSNNIDTESILEKIRLWQKKIK